MKRSHSIRLVLIGSLSAGAVTGCGPSVQPAVITAENVYTNNYYVAGVGYYHAPFRNWYPLPYNHYEAAGRRYYFGGQWAAAPHQSFTNISSPLPEVVALAEAQRTDVVRRGFGSTSRSHHIWS